jgi:hypothetical protein
MCIMFDSIWNLICYYIIISDEIFKLSHVTFIIQFLSRKYKMWINFFSQVHVRFAYLFFSLWLVEISNLDYATSINNQPIWDSFVKRCFSMPQLGAVNDSRFLQFNCMLSGARRCMRRTMHFLINKDLFLKIKRILIPPKCSSLMNEYLIRRFS